MPRLRWMAALGGAATTALAGAWRPRRRPTRRTGQSPVTTRGSRPS